jgi:hypothetical protein
MEQVTVVTDALRKESGKWRDLSDRAVSVRRTVEQLHLAPSAFFIGDQNMVLHSRAYDTFQTFISDVLDGAAVEFEQIGTALSRVADAYDDADAVVTLDLDEVFRA